MASNASQHWFAVAAERLDELENAHAAVGGKGRGRRYATQQINHAYAVLLSSQFQRYCRDLHTESASIVANHASTPTRQMLFRLLTLGRKLDVGNPTAGHIGSDFARFDIKIWDACKRAKPATAAWQDTLNETLSWRNAIAHQDDAELAALGGTLHLREVQGWRKTCSRLVRVFDRVLAEHLHRMFGTAPW